MPTHVKISTASDNYFDSNRAFTVILYIQAYLDRGYFWALFQLPPAIIYENKERYRNVIKIDNDEKLVSSDLRNNYLMSCFMLILLQTYKF
jgi:hypothetical protein